MINSRDQIAFIVLAAGYSRRFAGNKLLARMANGKTVLRNTCESFTRVSDNILVVFNSAVPGSREALEGGDRSARHFATIEVYSAGLGDSIAAAVRHSANCRGWVLCLGDMPFIQQRTLEDLRARIREYPEKIVRPRFQGREGHPVFFPAKLYDELCRLDGDVGARAIVGAHREDLICFAVSDPGTLRDIDCKADLENNNENQ